MLEHMPVEPRTPERRPVRASPGFPEVGVPPSFLTVEEPREAPQQVPVSRHIPRYIVLPSAEEEGASTAQTTGAHRFPRSPTPVLGASLGLMGFVDMEAACRPWRRRGKEYRVARIRAGDQSGATHALSSARLPKV